MSTEWWYIRQWNSNQQKIWTVVDSKKRIYLENGTFTDRRGAEELLYSLTENHGEANNTSFTIVHHTCNKQGA